MPLPELISELEWEQHKSWDSFSALLKARVESTLKEKQQLQNRIAFLEATALKTEGGHLGLPRRGSVQVQMK